RPDTNHNVALSVDIDNSTLPPLEYYCEYNGERDYLNFLFSAAIGNNRTVKTVNGGTIWSLYGDMLPWNGTNPADIYEIPLLYNYTINKPVITKTGDTLRSSQAQSYQWLLNSGPISNEIKQFIVPAVSGNYSVIVTDTNTLCSDTSDTYPINISKINTQQLSDNFNISPNPCNKEVNIQLLMESKSDVIITMYDLLFNKSSVVYQNKLMDAGNHKLNLKLNDFSNGIYILKIQTNKSTYTGKVIICRN
ncbi:MAG: T9SS type A sorting domain-containing protein, partial [Bacteroidales bacterium]|nr:T9SS type A sorting domain-containing protein [Bacteroidales bacterium]